MIKINSTQVVSKELRKVRHFSSIVTKKLKSESISSENINSFTFEELTDINKILSLTDFILTKYEHKKSMRLILNEFVDLITKSANSLESSQNDSIFNENKLENEVNSKNSVNNLTIFSTDVYSPNYPSKIICNS
jgi:glycogen debranching enzyme